MDKIEQKMGQYSEGQTAQAERAALEIFAQFGAIRHTDPAGEQARALAKKWQAHINKYYYECPDEIMPILGNAYASDESFVQFTDDFGEGTALFMSQAIMACFDKH